MQVIKILLNNESKGKKPLNIEDNLTSIRQKITGKIDIPFVFLDEEGNEISTQDEDDITLGDIISNEKILKIKSMGDKNFSIKIFINKKEFCCLNCSESSKLNEIRDLLKEKIREDFIFLDGEYNNIPKEEETIFEVCDILNDKSIQISINNSPGDTPPNENNNIESNKDNNKGIETEKEKIVATGKNQNICKISDFSKYEIIKKREDLITYKYSNVERKSNHDLVYQYFYDRFEPNDFNDAYVILFCGKTGDGKTTAINAIFNIIKGVKLEDNYRFILINEPEKKRGQAESKTDGVHLYYLRDYNNKPVIIIDSQGYGDVRGIEYDEMLTDAFEYVFTNIIDHINVVLFILNSLATRIDILIKYIFYSISRLFAEDISSNFIILATYANKETMRKGPSFIYSIKTEANYLKLEGRLDSNWWFAIDSKCILDNEISKITKYSFSQAEELYEGKIKKLNPKNIKKCSEVLYSRLELIILIENLNTTFQILMVQQINLEIKEKNIDEKNEQIIRLESTLNDLENHMDTLNPKELEEKLSNLNIEVNKKINEFLNEKEDEIIQTLEPSETVYTLCDLCKKNCHAACDCLFNFLGRCKVFSILNGRCHMCGCNIINHKKEYYKYSFIYTKKQKYTDYEIDREKQNNEMKKKKIMDDINKNNEARNNLEKQKNEFYCNKKLLILEREKIQNEKNEIQKNIKDIDKQIIFIIIKLQTFLEKLNDITMNNNYAKSEEDYIDYLMEKIIFREKEKIKKTQQIKENYRIFLQTSKLDKKDLMKLDDTQLAGVLKVIIPNYKK